MLYKMREAYSYCTTSLEKKMCMEERGQRWVTVKAGLWTVDWTLDWNMDCAFLSLQGPSLPVASSKVADDSRN